jgi:hypothetical protein
MTKLWLPKYGNIGRVGFGPKGTSGDPNGGQAIWTCVQWPPNLVHSLYTQWRTQGRPCTPHRPTWRVEWRQPKARWPKPKSGHITDPFHQQQTHSRGIQHIESMIVHIKGGDGVHVASPMDPWAHKPKKENSKCDQILYPSKKGLWITKLPQDRWQTCQVDVGQPQYTLTNVWDPPNWLRSLPIDSRELPQP